MTPYLDILPSAVRICMSLLSTVVSCFMPVFYSSIILFSQGDEICMAVTPSGMCALLVFLTCALE